jgi:hypothetical protein
MNVFPWWKAPLDTVYKINKTRKLMGVRIIVRNHMGKVLAPMCI